MTIEEKEKLLSNIKTIISASMISYSWTNKLDENHITEIVMDNIMPSISNLIKVDEDTDETPVSLDDDVLDEIGDSKKDYVKNVVRDLISDRFFEHITIGPDDSSLFEDLGLDSLDIVEIAICLENRFGIKIPDSDMDQVTTIQDVINVVKSALA